MAEEYESGAGFKVKLNVLAFDEEGHATARYENEDDLITQQFAVFTVLNILATGSTQNVIGTTGSTYSVVGLPATVTATAILAGIGTNAASVTDIALGTLTAGSSGSITATVNWAAESSGTSGTFTVTGTITNSSGSSVTYSELGIVVTEGTHQFLLTHDVFSGVVVSNNGTLAITYTLTNS